MHSVSTTNTWTACIHFSSTASVANLLSSVDNSLIVCRGQFVSTRETEEWTECPVLPKRDSLEKNTKKIVQLLPETKSTPTSGSVFADMIEQVKTTKFELELIKIVVVF